MAKSIDLGGVRRFKEELKHAEMAIGHLLATRKDLTDALGLSDRLEDMASSALDLSARFDLLERAMMAAGDTWTSVEKAKKALRLE